MNAKDTKNRIIEAATLLLGRDGPQGFSASALAKEVGVSKATIFHHFNSLDEIPLAALDVMSQQFLDWSPPKESTLAEMMENFGDMTFEMVRKHRNFLNAYFVFFGKAMFDQKLRKQLQASVEEIKLGIKKRVEMYVDDPDDAQNLANMLMILLDGASLHILTLENEKEVKMMWKSFCKIILESRFGK